MVANLSMFDLQFAEFDQIFLESDHASLAQIFQLAFGQFADFFEFFTSRMLLFFGLKIFLLKKV